MAVRGAERTISDARLSTGNPELDQILMGGLMPHRPYLIVGPSGTGKTTLALQFLCEGARRGERCLIVTLEEPPNEMRANHPGLSPELDQVYVFDAIPDVMRYERTPFKDIAAVRESVPFSQVGPVIRKTPELSSVEVTFTALEQTLKMEIARRSYSRLVIDSLTALQYFCMKGVDESVGAQTFLRFLSDLRVTTVLTVEAPLEDAETPERLLARGEIRLFRWELEGRTVRAIGVEKFRGSQHDIRLHPYRLSPRGLHINLDQTISRDTRRLVETSTPLVDLTGSQPSPEELVAPLLENLDALESDVRDLLTVGVELEPVREALAEAANVAVIRERDEALREYQRLRATVQATVEEFRQNFANSPPGDPPAVAEAARRLLSRAAEARTGVPPILPTYLPIIAVRLTALRDTIPVPEGRVVRIPPPPPPPAIQATLPPAPVTSGTSTPSVPLPVPIYSVPIEPPPTPLAGADRSPPPLPGEGARPGAIPERRGRAAGTTPSIVPGPGRTRRHSSDEAIGRPSLPQASPPPSEVIRLSDAEAVRKSIPPITEVPIAVAPRRKRRSPSPSTARTKVPNVPTSPSEVTTPAPPGAAAPPPVLPPESLPPPPKPVEPFAPVPLPTGEPAPREPTTAPVASPEKTKRRAPRKRKPHAEPPGTDAESRSSNGDSSTAAPDAAGDPAESATAPPPSSKGGR